MIGSKKEIPLWWHLNEGKPNYGDIMNPWLVEKISQRPVKRKELGRFSFGKVYVVIGSVMAIVRSNCIVWGSGIIKKDDHPARAKFLAVRGPHTRNRLLELGYECPEIFGDPALLLPKYFNPPVEKTHRLGVIPHYVNYKEVYDRFNSTDIKVINLIDPDVEKVTREIMSCEMTMSSSLHGIIISHAYNIPSLWTKFDVDLYGDDVKFEDYFESVGIVPYPAFNSSILEEISKAVTLIHDHPAINSIQKDYEEICNNLMSVCPFK